MARFLKLDMTDDDNFFVKKVEAATVEQVIDEAYGEILADDRLCPCYGFKLEECITKDHNSVQWAPGDGSRSTVILVVPDTPEGLAEVQAWLIN